MKMRTYTNSIIETDMDKNIFTNNPYRHMWGLWLTFCQKLLKTGKCQIVKM